MLGPVEHCMGSKDWFCANSNDQSFQKFFMKTVNGYVPSSEDTAAGLNVCVEIADTVSPVSFQLSLSLHMK